MLEGISIPTIATASGAASAADTSSDLHPTSEVKVKTRNMIRIRSFLGYKKKFTPISTLYD
jgi:hypothetical protein